MESRQLNSQWEHKYKKVIQVRKDQKEMQASLEQQAPQGQMDTMEQQVLPELQDLRDPRTGTYLTPDYDSGWINISSKAGQYITLTHNLNSVDTIVQITGKTTVDGQAHQKYYGLTNYISGWNKTFGGQ